MNTMRKIFVYISLAAALFVSGGCTAPRPVAGAFYVSILPLRPLVTGIVGDDFPVEVLVPSGAGPETFEPTVRQISALNEAQLVFGTGLLSFETALLSKIADRRKVIALNSGVEPIAGACTHDHGGQDAAAGHHHAHGVDPHIWTSPKALRRMAANAYEAIHALYPDSVRYTENYEALQAEIDRLDERVGETLARSGVSYFMIYHPALTYYARDYGIRQIAVEQEGKEPSAKRMAVLIDQARADCIARIFYQSQYPRSTVETIARDMGAEAVEIDPLREDVLRNIAEITDLIAVRR